MIFYFFVFFVIFGATSKIAVLPAWELNSGERNPLFYVFLCFLKMLKKQVFAWLVFSCFFIILGAFWGAFWVSFGVLLESPSFLWRAGVMLSVAFGLPEPSVGFLCHFLCCLWLVRAVFGLGDRSRTAFCSILGLFWDHFGSFSEEFGG